MQRRSHDTADGGCVRAGGGRVGGSAVGTGLNTLPDCGPKIAAEIAIRTGHPFVVKAGRDVSEQGDAEAWVRERFTDPGTNIVDARVLGRVARDLDFARQLRELMVAPQDGPLYRFDVGRPSEAARATPLSLDQLNARLGLVGARAVPFQGTPPFGTERLWTVYVAESHVDAVHVLLAGLYGLSFGPDEMLSEELRHIDENEPTGKRLQEAVARRLAALGRGQDAQHHVQHHVPHNQAHDGAQDGRKDLPE
jgi:hypothetical protein